MRIVPQLRVQSVEWQSLQPILFEFMLRDTPQHNDLVELAFLFLEGKVCEMMGAALVPIHSHGKVAIKAIKCATHVDGLTVVEVGRLLKTRNEHVMGKNPNWVKNLHTWGEARVAIMGTDGKTGDHGLTMMFSGYPFCRESDPQHKL